MEIRFKDIAPESFKTDLLVVPVSEKRLEERSIRALDRRLKGRLQERIQKSKFAGTEGASLLYSTGGVLPAANLLLIGLGKAPDIDAEIWRTAGARARREASALAVEDIAFFFSPERDPASAAAAIIEGALLASYQFTKYRSNAKNPLAVKTFTLHKPGLTRSSSMDQAVRTAEQIVGGVFLARDLINEPPSVTTARYLGEQAERRCRGRGLSVDVWGKKKIESMKLAGLLAVNRGSQEEPRFITIHYKPEVKPRKKIALIGKGITFDSGGLSLKPSKSMETMKLDMAGGAAVIAPP